MLDVTQSVFGFTEGPPVQPFLRYLLELIADCADISRKALQIIAPKFLKKIKYNC